MHKVVKAELDRIRTESASGLLHKRAVIDSARSEESPLHSQFTWDAEAALEKNLLREAGDLIREYTVILTTRDDRPVMTRHLVSLSSDRLTGGGYRVVTEVLGEQALAEQFMSDAIAELAAARAKYGRIKELSHIFVLIDEAQEQQQEKKQRKRKAA